MGLELECLASVSGPKNHPLRLPDMPTITTVKPSVNEESQPTISASLLQAKGCRLSKTLIFKSTGIAKGKRAEKTKWHTVERIQSLDSLDKIKELHDRLLIAKDTLLVRAAIHAEALENTDKLVDQKQARRKGKSIYVRRTKKVFDDIASTVVWFDIEGNEVAFSKFGTSLEDCLEKSKQGNIETWTRNLSEKIREKIFRNTPFQKVRCWAGLTSSHGTSEEARLRFCFLLSKPMTNKQILAWLRTNKLTIKQGGACDEALYHVPQAHYTAAPIIEGGLADPFWAGRSLLTSQGPNIPEVVDVTSEMLEVPVYPRTTPKKPPIPTNKPTKPPPNPHPHNSPTYPPQTQPKPQK